MNAMEPLQVASLIQATLVPVIMISAVALIALVVQNRHAVVLERTFRINARRSELWEQLREMDPSAHPLRARWVRGQYEIQEELLSRWVQRGSYTGNALVAAFLGVFLFGLTSFDTILNVLLSLSGSFAALTLAFFLAGIISFLACFIFVLIDVYQALEITRLEIALMDELREELRHVDHREWAA